MWLFLDDIRMPPDGNWHVVRTATEAIEFLKTGKVERISFDQVLTAYENPTKSKEIG